jgi:outer membrane protein OmpA-like peptidoglycan-associated protein
MNLRAFALPLFASLGAPLPAAHADDVCTQLIVYAVNQFCRLMPNGQSLCQPVALTGPAPACKLPEGTALKPVPLAPPSVRPAQPWGMPYAGNMAPFLPYGPYAGAQGTPYPLPYAPFPPNAWQANPQPALPAASMAAVQTAASPAGNTPQATAANAAEAPQAAAAPSTAIPLPTPAATVPAPQPEGAVSRPAAEDVLTHFAFDSAELTAAGRETLDAWLAHAPAGMPVVVSGYADRLGPEPYNLRLSQRRAEAVRRYLVAKGRDARDVRIVAKGEADPVKRCKGGPTPATKACLAPNRRVQIDPE